MSHNNPPVRNAVIAAIKEHGPMTCNEVAEVLGWTIERTHSVIANGRRLHPGKLFRVIRYQPSRGKGKDQAVYAVQAGKDKPRPTTDMKVRRHEALQRYRNKHRATINARHRQARAAKAGSTVPQNPWMQLAPVELRSVMTLQARRGEGVGLEGPAKADKQQLAAG